MGDILNSDQEILVTDSIRALNRVHMHSKDESAKTLASDLIWDLTLLHFPEARDADTRSVAEVQTNLRETGAARLADLRDKVSPADQREVATAQALLKVAGIAPETEQQQAAATASWRDRVSQPSSQAQGRSK